MSEIDWARKLFKNPKEETNTNTSLSQNSSDLTSVRTGVVTAVNDDGSVQVRLDGSNTVITVKPETPVKVGDSIKIIKQGQTWMVYAMKTYVNETQKKIDDLHNEIETKGAEIQGSVKQDIDKVQGDLDAFKQTHTMTDADISTSITSNNNTLNAKIEGVQSDLTENYAKKTEVSASIDGLRTEVSENYVNSSTLGTETSKLQSQITQNSTAIATEVTDRKTAVSGAVSESKAYTDQQADSISSTVEKNVMNSVGETYATKSEVTQTASGLEVKITNAVNAANDAAKKATDYLNYSSSGLEIGNENLNANVLINATSVNIRNGSQNLASFKSDGVSFYNSSGGNIAQISANTGVSTYSGGSSNTVHLQGNGGLGLLNLGTQPSTFTQSTPFPLGADSNTTSNVCYLAGGVCLYASTSGSNGSISLKLSTSKSVSDYKWMDIFFTDGNRHYSQRVPSPASGGTFSLFSIVYNPTINGGSFYTHVNMYTWTARGITIGNAGQGFFNGNNQCGDSQVASPLLKITQVIGWR